MKKLRILYIAGHGNVIGTYRHWKKGEDDPSRVSITHSGQFYDVCKEFNAKAYVIASCKKRGFIKEGLFKIEHKQKPFQNSKNSVLYHLGQIYSGLRSLFSAFKFHANLAIVCEGATHWFMLSFMSLLRIKIIPNIQCVLWPKYKKVSKIRSIINKLDGRFFSKKPFAIISMSNDITKQINKLTKNQGPPIINFLPTYKKEYFSNIKKPNINEKPFRVLFAGRIEKDKGILDLLDIANHFKKENITDIVFDVCGDGHILNELKNKVKKLGLSNIFICHGYCKMDSMKKMLSNSHILVVPTTIDFIEGFNQVIAESILANRPVITSSVCPALAYVRDAAVEVAPNDTGGYKKAILRLYKNKKFYEKKQKACLRYQEQFYDEKNSWGAVIKKILLEITEK